MTRATFRSLLVIQGALSACGSSRPSASPPAPPLRTPEISRGPNSFPGAEGFGALATGGRGGDVYHVTSLADDGAGSLRDGITGARGPRTIVFDVGGTIALRSTLLVRQPNITIAGQTAPGDGITLRDESLEIKGTHDIIVRHLRVRRGDLHVRAEGRPANSRGLDSISIDRSRNVIIDHVSASWSCDETFGITKNQDVTIQWCLVAEPLGDPPLHPYGNDHAFGLNTSANRLSFHHSLVANYVMRGPQFEANDAVDGQGYDVEMEAVDNVLFDYKKSGSRYTTGIEENPESASHVAFRFHFVNNFYLREPSRRAPDILAVTKHGISDQVRIYVSGNIGPNRSTNDLDPWRSVIVEGGGDIRQGESGIREQMSDRPLFVDRVPITVQDADSAYELVLNEAGANRTRDAVDRRIVQDVKAHAFRDYVRSQDQVGGWPALVSVSRPVGWDTDRDGMPDAWETAHGLNSNDPEDRNVDGNRDGTTNLERYLNETANSP